MQLELERFFDARSIVRGATYAREGRVVKLQGPSPTGELTATVLGSDIYQVALKLSFDASLRLTRVKGTCSCPVGALCKHMAAVLLTWQNLRAKPAPLTPDPPAPASRSLTLPWQVTQWLAAMTVTAQAAQAPDYPATVRDRLVYILGLSSSGLSITAMKATVSAGGRVSEWATRYDVDRLKRQEARPQFILRKDLDILRDLEAIGMAANGGGSGSFTWRPKFVDDGAPDLMPVLPARRDRTRTLGREGWAFPA